VAGVGDVRGEVGDRADAGVRLLREAAKERAHGEAAVLKLLQLELFEVTLLGELEGVEAPAGVQRGLGEAVRGLRQAAAVRLGEAQEDHLERHDGVEGGEAGALGREGCGRAGERVVLQARRGRAQRAGLVPRDAGGLLLRDDAGDGEHGPAAVNHLVLGSLVHGQDVVVPEGRRRVRIGGAGVGAGLLQRSGREENAAVRVRPRTRAIDRTVDIRDIGRDERKKRRDERRTGGNVPATCWPGP
jgi:hypothetical protein